MDGINIFGIEPRTFRLIPRVLAAFPEIDEAIIFGSRATGKFRNGSDIDIAIRGKKLNAEIVDDFRSTITSLPSPYYFDIVYLDELADDLLRKEIYTFGKFFYKNS